MKTKNYRLIEKAMHDFKILHTDTENTIYVSECSDEYFQQLSFVWYGKNEKSLQIILTTNAKKPSSNVYSVYSDFNKLFTIKNIPLHKALENVREWLGHIECMIEPLVIHC